MVIINTIHSDDGFTVLSIIASLHINSYSSKADGILSLLNIISVIMSTSNYAFLAVWFTIVRTLFIICALGQYVRLRLRFHFINSLSNFCEVLNDNSWIFLIIVLSVLYSDSWSWMICTEKRKKKHLFDQRVLCCLDSAGLDAMTGVRVNLPTR